VFKKAEPEGQHLHSEVQDQIEKWVCEDPACRADNRMSVRACEKCGRVLPLGIMKLRMKQFVLGKDGVMRKVEFDRLVNTEEFIRDTSRVGDQAAD